jgi:Protein of unknown function (DUF2612)
MKIQEFDYSVDLLQTILWQYDQATSFVSLIKSKQNWYNVNFTQFWADWYNNVFNLLTANKFGLTVWSIILNVPPYLIASPEDPDKPIWGFNAYDPTFPDLENTYLNFQNGNFSLYGTVISLTVEEQRFLLRLRYFQLSTRADVTDINQFLAYLLASSNIGYTGVLYMLDNLDMTITYCFNTSFPTSLYTVLTTLGVLPRPAGVRVIYTFL